MPTSFVTTRTDGADYTWLDIKEWGDKWTSPTFRLKPWTEVKSIQFLTKITEPAVKVSERDFVKKVQVLVARDIKIMESLANTFSKPFNQAFKIKESQVSEVQMMIDERVEIKELVEKELRLLLDEAFKAREANQTNAITKAIQTKLTIAESYDHLHTYIRDFLETTKVSEVSDTRSVEKSVDSLFSVMDDLIFDGIYQLGERIEIEEKLTRAADYIREPIYNFSVFEDTPYFNITKKQDVSNIFIKEDSFRHPSIRIPDEPFYINEYLDSSVDFNRFFDEKIKASESIQKIMSMPFEERISIVDEMLKNGDLSISDMIVLSKAMSDSDFQEIMNQSSPKGYGPFKPFLAGDYDYKEVLLRILMTTKNQSRPYIEQLNVEVDLPDIFDSGDHDIVKAEIDAKGFSRIKFNRHFYTIPEVSVAIKAGKTKFVPSIRIISITSSHFDLALENPQTDVPVLGMITWKAQGY